MAEATSMPWQTPFGSRTPNDSSAVAAVLVFRENGDGNGMDPPSIQRSELLPVDEPRGSIGCALQAKTQKMRASRPSPAVTAKTVTSPPQSPLSLSGRRSLTPVRWQTLENGRGDDPGALHGRRSFSVGRDRSVSRDRSASRGRSDSTDGRRSASTDARDTAKASAPSRATNSYARPSKASAPETFDNKSTDKIKELENRVQGLQRLNLVLRSELPADKADVAAESAARMRQSSAVRGAFPKDDSQRDSFRNSRPRSVSQTRERSPAEEGGELIGPHNRRCNSSSPMSSPSASAGKFSSRRTPRPVLEVEPVVAKSLPSMCSSGEWAQSVDSTEFPKGRKVLIDKNAPSEHWMASETSETHSEMKYDWQNGHPNIEWKRKVPDAIPVRPKQEKRLADPQGRPWVRQFSATNKNMHSEPWTFPELHANKTLPDGSSAKAFFPELNPGTSGKRLFRNPSKNAHNWQLHEDKPMAGRGSREASPTPSATCSTRKQFGDMQKNQPSDLFFSPMGTDPPGATHWVERSPRSKSPPSAWRNTMRYQPMPGDRGLSPITGERRAVGPERPIREAVYAR